MRRFHTADNVGNRLEFLGPHADYGSVFNSPVFNSQMVRRSTSVTRSDSWQGDKPA